MADHKALLDRAKDHEHRLVARPAQQRGGVYRRLNRWLAARVTRAVGTVTCAYIFLLIALLSARAAFASGNLVIIVQWVSGALLQLVLLPLIIVGQNVQAEISDRRAEADHETLQLLHSLATAILELQHQQVLILNQQTKILSRLEHAPR